jgi:hypothetical protein
MDLAGIHRQIDPFQDLVAIHPRMQILNFQQTHRFLVFKLSLRLRCADRCIAGRTLS